MEVFVRNLPEQLSEKQLRDFLRPIFTSLSIDSFCCQKLRKGCATVTILDPQLGQKFLDLHGQSSGTRRGTQAIRQLHHMGRAIHVSASRNKPDTYLLRSLREEKQKLQQSKETKTGKGPIIRHERKFPCSALACGLWDYAGSDLVFISYFTDSRKGAVTFGTKSLAVLLDPPSVQIPKVQIDIPYNSVRSITVGDGSNLSLTLTLLEAPRIYEDSADALKTLLLGAFDNLSLRTQPKSFKKSRITSISKAHESVVSSCFVYRLSLSGTSISQVRALKNFREVPSCIFWPTAVTDPERSFASETTELISTLCLQYEELPFSLKFQMQKLAQNGYLPPSRIVALLPEILHMVSRSGVATTLHATRKLFNQIPFAGPETEAKELGLRGLTELLARSELSSQIEMLYLSDHVERHEHIAPTYKATVTPAGTYLYGPDPEPKNRVLRKYSDHSDFFLRVTFVDEDGEPIRFDNNASNGQIYHERFKRVLGGVINIAGRGYEFLGFSHSSLRSQTCWFMAPFVQNGELFHARAVIAKLGDFSAIRSPAKCAARIGQAFSETSKTVKLPPNAVRTMKDVERSGRVFSDGVGTFSNSILQRIWKEYATSHILKPKLFQIRYAGAKGMISLDTRLQGDTLLLRPSMIKFTGSDATDIEICGAGIRPLPFVLNRQLIKIMEDLGVDENIFLDLQAEAVEQLRSTTLSPVNAASFLQRNLIGKAAQLSWLIRKLDGLGLPFQADNFLSKTLEMAVLVQLRELKHRSRIPVKMGVTLYGIMDETGYLQEGEIFCVSDSEADGRSVITGRDIVITRSPALHPGDIQLVTAVTVPADSPLNDLHNCVVFSQKGQRDLPSQLSGGDLDGDLYHIIYDPALRPTSIEEPANYPRVQQADLVPRVERHHMADFFIQFMENDRLGWIATLHQTLADQKPRGTLDPSCILLADKHSTAVDFSKTGIPVNLSDSPRYSRCRPDFMATGPHVVVEKEAIFLDEEPRPDEDAIAALGDGRTQYRYYESQKVLGKLYRAIDEVAVFRELQKQSSSLGKDDLSSQSIMQRLWSYVQNETCLIQWRHHQDWARDIQETYEDCLIDTMYQYSTHPVHYLSELEVFIGNIIGKVGAQSKRQREYSTSMKEKFERDVTFTINCILKDPVTGKESEESLERSIACLAVAMEENIPRKKVGVLRSFAYIAAAVCLKEVEKFQGPLWG